ncbi:MAG: 6-hydroxymethylpterin diphosphokinase MptE-like protein, partial [Pleurocapsa sp.]
MNLNLSQNNLTMDLHSNLDNLSELVRILKQSNQKIQGLKNKHQGERCVIIGNGSSLNKMDLSFLKDEICFGLNKIYLGFEKWNFIPQYYVAVNSLVLEQNAAIIQTLPCIKFISNRGYPYIQPQEDIIFIKTHPYQGADFSIDPSLGINEGNTVTYVTMQLAYYMGFKTVILIGVDHNFITQGTPHQEITSSGDDPNHFHPNYFGQGVRWHLPDLAGSEKYYKIAYAHFWLNGRQIIDATVDGKCTIFPKQ